MTETANGRRRATDNAFLTAEDAEGSVSNNPSRFKLHERRFTHMQPQMNADER